MSNIRKGDTVLVIAGKDRGTEGTVLQVLKDRDMVVVEGVNRAIKHTKKVDTQRGGTAGGIVHQEAPIHVSNVALFNPQTKKADRVGVKTLAEVIAKAKAKPGELKIGSVGIGSAHHLIDEMLKFYFGRFGLK